MEMAPLLNYDLFLPVMENLPLAVLLIDQDYRYVYCNSFFLTFSGLTPLQVNGLSWSQFLPEPRKKMLLTILSEMKKPDVTSQNQTYTFSHNQNPKPDWTITKGKDDKLGDYYLLTFPTQQRLTPETMSLTEQANEQIFGSTELEKMNIELAESNKLKDRVLSIIAHDMRAPIAALKGLTSTLLDTDLNTEDRILLREDLLKQLSAVADLTENILLWATNSFTKTEANTKETLQILDVIESNKPIIEQQALAKKITIQYDIPEGLKILVHKDQFSMVIRNLATNAIKYTPSMGHISISAEVVESCIQIKITDNGIGISEEHQKSLFSFSQTSTYGTNGEKGIGLGLLLCKEYVEANAGKISITSKLNSGTTVVTEFPLAF